MYYIKFNGRQQRVGGWRTKDKIIEKKLLPIMTSNKLTVDIKLLYFIAEYVKVITTINIYFSEITKDAWMTNGK